MSAATRFRALVTRTGAKCSTAYGAWGEDLLRVRFARVLPACGRARRPPTEATLLRGSVAVRAVPGPPATVHSGSRGGDGPGPAARSTGCSSEGRGPPTCRGSPCDRRGREPGHRAAAAAAAVGRPARIPSGALRLEEQGRTAGHLPESRPPQAGAGSPEAEARRNREGVRTGMKGYGFHGPATLRIEDLWSKNITLTTGSVDTRSTPTLLRTAAAGRFSGGADHPHLPARPHAGGVRRLRRRRRDRCARGRPGRRAA